MSSTRRRWLSAVATGLGVSLAVAACSGGGGASAGSETLQDAHHNEPETWLGKSDQGWAEDVTELSDGDLHINFHWASSLAGAADSVEAMGSGTSQIGLLFPVYAPGGFEVDAWIADLAFLSSPHPVIGDMQAWAASLEWALETPEKIEEFRERGVEPLLPHFEINANYYLACTEPVTSLDDARGKKVRVAGAAWAKEAEALGMATTETPPGEMFEALQRGVIDCSLNPFRDMVDFGLLDVANHITADDDQVFSGFNVALGVNKDWWDQQDTERKQAIWRSLQDYPGRQLQAAVGQDFVVPQQAEELGLELHNMSPDMRDALAGNQDKRIEEAIENAPAELEDPEAVIAAFQESMDRWYEIVHDELGYGDSIPASWEEIVESGMTVEDIDFGPWSERVWEEILEPRMPN